MCAERWKVDIPEEAAASFARTRARWGMSEPPVSPVSNSNLVDLTTQMSSHAVPDLLARNVQKIAPAPQAQYTRGSIHQLSNGLAGGMMPSPSSTVDTRRSSGGMSLPPQSAADLSRLSGRSKPSIHLTKAQQDAWNAHVAARLNTAPPKAVSDANAATLFGGVDSLVEESQDWWLRDQFQLAVGFENWMDPNMDWSGLGFDTNTTMPSSNGNGVQASYNSGLQNGYTSYPANNMPPKQNNGTNGIQNSQFSGFDDEVYF